MAKCRKAPMSQLLMALTSGGWGLVSEVKDLSSFAQCDPTLWMPALQKKSNGLCLCLLSSFRCLYLESVSVFTHRLCPELGYVGACAGLNHDASASSQSERWWHKLRCLVWHKWAPSAGDLFIWLIFMAQTLPKGQLVSWQIRAAGWDLGTQRHVPLHC